MINGGMAKSERFFRWTRKKFRRLGVLTFFKQTLTQHESPGSGTPWGFTIIEFTASAVRLAAAGDGKLSTKFPRIVENSGGLFVFDAVWVGSVYKTQKIVRRYIVKPAKCHQMTQRKLCCTTFITRVHCLRNTKNLGNLRLI